MSKSINNYEQLSEEILVRHDTLSKRLKQIASFALENPTTIALDTIAGIAQNAGVQPSALIRFAKAFNFSGFSEMQRIFQAHTAEQSASYKERIQQEITTSNKTKPNTPSELLSQFCAANKVSLEHLNSGIDSHQLTKAVDLLRKAEQIYVMGQRRSFPIATYLTYALSHVDYRVQLLDGIGGLILEQAQVMTKKDALIAISFHPYSPETQNVFSIAESNKVPSVSITDSALSPIATQSTHSFIVHDAEVHAFRSLVASFCLAQTIATSLAFIETSELRKTKAKVRKPSPDIAPVRSIEDVDGF